VLAALTKITSIIILVALIPTVLFACLRGRWRWAAWALLGLGTMAFALAAVRWDDSAGWYRNTAQAEPTRAWSQQAPVGQYVLAVRAGAEVTPAYYTHIFQHFPNATTSQLVGKNVTFGYWIWSDQEQQVSSPVLRTNSQSFSETLLVSEEPTFYAFRAAMPEDLNRIWVELDARDGADGSWIYVDGVVLVEGEYSTSQIPVFSTGEAEGGVWGGRSFTNLVRNGSGEISGIRMAPWIDNRLARRLPDQARPSLLLASLLDKAGGGYLYGRTAEHLFLTYWARFGWGNVPPALPELVERLVFYFSLLGIIGAVIGGVRARKLLPWDVIAVMAVATLPLLFMAVTRGGAYLASPGFYIPTARYIYPAVIPLALLLTCGWLEIFYWIRILFLSLIWRERHNESESLHTRPDRLIRIEYGLYLLFFIVINLLSLAGIRQYFPAN
jgi:hypothetical protein